MRIKYALLLILLFLSHLVSARKSDETKLILDSVEFEIDGITKPKAIMRHIDIEIGKEFSSYEKFTEYLGNIRQQLINRRVFYSVSYIKHIVFYNESITKYKVVFRIKDSWTLFAIPYPKFDSNTGFSLGLQVFYSNAFGTMTDWFLGFKYDFGNQEYRINPKVSNVKLWGLTYSFSVAQSFEVERKLDKDKVLAHWSYNTSSFSIGTSIPLFTQFYYSFTPSFTFRYSYKDIAGKDGFTEDNLDFSYNHRFGISKVDWIGNFRKGFAANAGHNLSVLNRIGKATIANTIGISGSYYIPWKILNFYTKAGIDFAIEDELRGYGSHVRGVVNDEMYGTIGAYLNTSLGIEFWHLPQTWSAQVHPFVDIGINYSSNAVFNLKDRLKVGVGMDFVLYLDALKNLVARGTIGFDLTSGKPLYESYEITITSSLHF